MTRNQDVLGNVKHLRALPFALLILLGLPAAADPFRPGIKDQIQLGKRVATNIRKEEKVLPDTHPRVKKMREIAQKILAQIPEKERKERPFEYSFDLIDNKEVNAFALPGGPIFFFTGLFDKFETEDQLAAVLAHEIIHVRNQHWASAYADRQKRQLGIVVLLSVLNANDTVFNIAGVADSLVVELPYSRRHETEADLVGYDLMAAAGYNPQGMIDTFRTFEKLKGGKGGPEWMSTHPADRNRIKRLEDRLKKEKRTFRTQVPLREGRRTALARTLALVSLGGPRNGLVSGVR